MMMLRRNTRGMLCSSGLPFSLKNSMALIHSRGTHRTEVSNVEDALKVFDEMIHSRPLPPVIPFNQGLYQQGLLVEAEKLMREMGGRGWSPNDWTYNTIIRGLLRNNKTSRVVQLIEEMKKCGFSADASTTELVYGLLSKDVVDPALLQFFQDSQQS